MNKIISPSVCLIALFMVACTGSEHTAGVASSSASNASSNRTSNLTKQPSSPINQGNLADQKAPYGYGFGSDVGGGGGGGGGGKNDPSVRAANISLTQASSSQIDAVPADRKIIRNAQLGIEAEKPEEIQQRITDIAQSKGGFVVASQQSSSDLRVSLRDVVEMSVRVSADKFTETLNEIKAGPGRILSETIKGEDVTEEFIDIDARLRAKKALEQQFMEIMKRASTVEDALNVQRELSDVRGEIEQIEGRRRFIENQASLSTITIKIQAPTVFAAETAGFGDRLSESFGRGFEVALNFILGLVTFLVGVLPFAILVGLPGYLLARSILRRRNRPMSVAEIAEDEIATE
jgi:hypothetical protein